MSAGVFVGVLGWVIAGLLAAFLAVLTVEAAAPAGRAGCRMCVCSWRGCCWCSARSSARRCLPVWGCGF